MPVEDLHAHGHEHVRATHASTVEITRDDWLTPAGDCIVGIGANRAPADFVPAFVRAARSPAARIELDLVTPAARDRIVGQGHRDLTFNSKRCLVARTSDYVDDRTILVGADRAAADLDRQLVAALREGAALTVRIGVTS